MGFQYRKRTKGKKSWFNFSGSSKNGLGCSLSVKLGKRITYNSRGRVTVNFGNGFRYVGYKKKKRVVKQQPIYTKKIPRAKRGSPIKYKEVVVTQYEVLCAAQDNLINVCKLGCITDDADLQVTSDLYNAIQFLKEEPNSCENRDLIVVTTNQYLDSVAKTGNKELIHNAKIITDYLRSTLPSKKINRVIRHSQCQYSTNYWLYALIFFVVILVYACVG